MLLSLLLNPLIIASLHLGQIAHLLLQLLYPAVLFLDDISQFKRKRRIYLWRLVILLVEVRKASICPELFNGLFRSLLELFLVVIWEEETGIAPVRFFQSFASRILNEQLGVITGVVRLQIDIGRDCETEVGWDNFIVDFGIGLFDLHFSNLI